MSPRLDRRFLSARNWLAAHRSVRDLGIGRSDLVLDVGSGQNPHPRANVLCDLFVADNTERANHGALRVDRPLVVSDAAAMPFDDGAFDFVFCSQLLEHVKDPAALLEELQRVASAGYIETPARVYEKLYGWRFHSWFVSVEGDRLRIEAKGRPIFDEDLHSWYDEQLQQPAFWRMFIPRLLDRKLLTTLVWRGTIAYEVTGSVDSSHSDFIGAEASSEVVSNHPGAQVTKPQRFKSRVDALRRRRSDARVGQVLAQLRCPTCLEPIRSLDDEARCEHCGWSAPILLPPA